MIVNIMTEIHTLDTGNGFSLGTSNRLVTVGVVWVARFCVLEQDVRGTDLTRLIHI